MLGNDFISLQNYIYIIFEFGSIILYNDYDVFVLVHFHPMFDIFFMYVMNVHADWILVSCDYDMNCMLQHFIISSIVIFIHCKETVHGSF